jgi:16S rRNA (guanine527-N7)-methyltransferase
MYYTVWCRLFGSNGSFHLIDARSKKIKVVKEVSEAIGLTNVKASHGRVEELKGQYDVIVTRAVAPLAKLWSWSSHLLAGKTGLEGGILAWKGGDLNEEIIELGGAFNVNMKRIDELYTEAYFKTKYLIHIEPNKK